MADKACPACLGQNPKLGLAHRSDYVDLALKIGLLAD
jgi:hypothetical protein